MGNFMLKIYPKPSITNVQIKSNSWPRIVRATLQDSHSELRNYVVVLASQNWFSYWQIHRNGYNPEQLKRIANKSQIGQQAATDSHYNERERKPVAILPWIPGFSQKLGKQFLKSGVQAVLRWHNKLENLLTLPNKPKPLLNNKPGVCLVRIAWCMPSKMLVQKNVFLQNWESSGLAEHTKICTGQIDRESGNL